MATKKSLESAVLQTAISARRLLNESLTEEQRDATYGLLLELRRYCSSTCADEARFIDRMLASYENDPKQRTLFEERERGIYGMPHPV